MASPNSHALTKRSADSALMPPPPPPKRQKRPKNVLDEDVYSDALEHIITRDFFPGLLETEAQQDYMAALDSKNSDWISSSGRRLIQVMTPGPDQRQRRAASFTPRRSRMTSETPRGYVGATPLRTPGTAGNANDFAPEQPEVDVNMSLSAFQAKYTSEDNESFNQLLDKQNAKRAEKFAFFHNGNKMLSARQIAYQGKEQKLLDRGSGSTSNALVRVNAQGEERRLLSAKGPSQDLDARPAQVDSFPNRQGPRNHFMFGPEGIEDTMVTIAKQAQELSNAPTKSVTYAATRFPTASTNPEHTVPASPSMSAIDAAIAGRPRATDSEPGYSGAETPRVNGYAFVDAEPTPSELGIPVSDEEAAEAERAEAMKFLPKVDESGPNPFDIKQRSEREELLHRLVDKADTARRKEKGGARIDQLRSLGITPAGRTPTPKFGSAPKGSVARTPAAQRLAARLRTPRRGGDMFGSGDGRGSWTPTPRVKKDA